jgi:hypothetical protein
MSYRRRIVGCGLLLCAAACTNSESDASFDSIAARGDSIAALAMRGFTTADSAAAIAEGARRVQTEMSEQIRGGGADQRQQAETSAGQIVVGTTGAGPIPPPPAQDLPSVPSRGPAVPVPSDDPARSVGDTVRGIVAVVGTAPMTQVTVQTADGSSVTVNGMAAGDIGRLGGAEVVIRGVRTSPREIVVTEYTVRTVDGVAAADGMLLAEANGLVLATSDGTRRRVSNAPAGLRALVGTRVWIAGSLERPTSFGRISRAR